MNLVKYDFLKYISDFAFSWKGIIKFDLKFQFHLPKPKKQPKMDFEKEKTKITISKTK